MSKKSTAVIVANHHTAPIVLPRRVMQGSSKVFRPITINPGRTEPIDSDLWDNLSKMSVIQAYISRRLLSIVKRTGEVGVSESQTSDLIPPELLGGPSDDEAPVQQADSPNGGPITTRTRRATVSNITIE